MTAEGDNRVLMQKARPVPCRGPAWDRPGQLGIGDWHVAGAQMVAGRSPTLLRAFAGARERWHGHCSPAHPNCPRHGRSSVCGLMCLLQPLPDGALGCLLTLGQHLLLCSELALAGPRSCPRWQRRAAQHRLKALPRARAGRQGVPLAAGRACGARAPAGRRRAGPRAAQRCASADGLGACAERAAQVKQATDARTCAACRVSRPCCDAVQRPLSCLKVSAQQVM